MSKSTISTFELFKLFPARLYLEGRLWPKGPVCPCCGIGERVAARSGGFYRCNQCKEDFTVRTRTIFERSHVPLHKWLYAMYLLVTARKRISSMQLAKEIGITQKSAWFVLHRLRKACGSDLTKLQGIVEIDEVYIGGDAQTIQYTIVQHVEVGSALHTDEHGAYKHESINHGNGGYVRSIPPCGDCHDDGTCAMNCSPATFPKAVAAAADVVLAYRPKPKSEPAKARKRLAAKNAKKGR